MNKIAVLWPNRMKNYERLHIEGVQVFENVGALNVEEIARSLPAAGFHAVVCTSGIEREVRQLACLPTHVVTSGYIDVLESFRTIESEYKLINKRIALLVHKNNSIQLSRLAPYLHNYIELFLFSKSRDVKRILQEIVKEEFDAVLTGPTGLSYSEAVGILAFPLCYSEETALDGIKQVGTLLTLNRKEILQRKQIQSAIDVAPNAIIATSADGYVNLCNEKMCQILHMSQQEVLNQPIVKIMKDPSWASVYQDGIVQRGTLVKIGRDNYFSTRLPIRQEQRIVGSVGTLQEVEQIRDLENKYRSLQVRGFVARYHFDDIQGRSDCMKEAIAKARIFAKTDLTILIEGETGTGKELFAQSIHNESPRKNGPFVAINCAALAESLLESELMGYEDGAFTGAKKGGKVGLFELAHNGTLFLDEINQMSLSMQSKLLRVIQERTVMRIGGNKMIPINVRIIAATNEKLQDKVKEKQFRSDLYYRINIMYLHLPPLRERKEDIPELIRVFAEQSGRNIPTEQTALLKNVKNYNWPGNIRELQNYVWRSMALLSCGMSLDSYLLDEYPKSASIDASVPSDCENSLVLKIGTLEEMERQIVQKITSLYSGNQSKAARVLNVSRNTISNKLS